MTPTIRAEKIREQAAIVATKIKALQVAQDELTEMMNSVEPKKAHVDALRKEYEGVAEQLRKLIDIK